MFLFVYKTMGWVILIAECDEHRPDGVTFFLAKRYAVEELVTFQFLGGGVLLKRIRGIQEALAVFPLTFLRWIPKR